MTNYELKIAFYMMGDENWIAGRTYLYSLFHALRQAYGNKVGLYLLTDSERQSVTDFANSILADGVIYVDLVRHWSVSWAINGLARRVTSVEKNFDSILRKHGIDVLFGKVLRSKLDKVLTLSLIPDFQHIWIPDMFSQEERLERDGIFLKSIQSAMRVILFSDAVKRDFESFAPAYAHKGHTLNPVSYIAETLYDLDPKFIISRYNLPEKFVYLPNQFWKHKNHELVFSSLKILKERGVNITVVCTGNELDYRHPAYFRELWQKLSQWDVRNHVIYLGLLPQEHVHLLMRQSVCVLNPSIFEGWGLTIDEARSIGKKTLLSDIPAHKEQNPPRATFFNPTDGDDLAEKLSHIWKEGEPGPDLAFEFDARCTLPHRLRTYGESFVSLCKQTIL